MVQGIPLVWKAVDEFFQQFINKAQMEILTKEDQYLEEASKEFSKPQGVVELEATLNKICAEKKPEEPSL
jgi:hypothetical protein